MSHSTDDYASASAELLECLRFELDCLAALSDALNSLQRVDQKKRDAARKIVSDAAPDAALGAQLHDLEQESDAFQQARSEELAMIDRYVERRTEGVVALLTRAKTPG
jgi:hypothetical protein